jgi:LPXTG-motif cell wall-anchored protein
VLPVLAILPEGSVRDETTFLILFAGLAVLVGAAIYLRIRRKKDEKL